MIRTFRTNTLPPSSQSKSRQDVSKCYVPTRSLVVSSHTTTCLERRTLCIITCHSKILTNSTLPSSSRSSQSLWKTSYHQISAAFFVAFLLSNDQIYCQTKLCKEMRRHKLKTRLLTRECLSNTKTNYKTNYTLHI